MRAGRRLFVSGGGTGGTPAFGSRLIQPGALAGGGLVTFSRAQVGSTAAALSSGGGGNWWTEYTADQPRWAGSARRLMLGGQRTTFNTRGRLIGGTGWGLTNVTAATITGPDGGAATANRLDEGTATGAHAALLTGLTATAGVSYAMSAIVRAGTCTSCQMLFANGSFGTTAFQNFDLAGGVLGTGGGAISRARIVALSGGWFWISAVATCVSTGATSPVQLNMTDSASAARNPSYTGTNRTLDVFWGWCESDAATPSSTILATTEPAAATRGQDNVTSAFGTLFPNGVGTALGSFLLPYAAIGADQVLFDTNDGSTNNRIWCRNVAGGNTIVLGRTIGGVNVDATTLGSMTPGTAFRVGLTFDGTNIVGNLDGGSNQSVAGMPAGLTTHRVGNNSAGTAPTFGEVGYVDTLPYALAPAGLPAAVSAMPF